MFLVFEFLISNELVENEPPSPTIFSLGREEQSLNEAGPVPPICTEPQLARFTMKSGVVEGDGLGPILRLPVLPGGGE